MLLKNYQKELLGSVDDFFSSLSKSQNDIARIPEDMRDGFEYVARTYDSTDLLYRHFLDRPRNGLNKMYPRVCIKVPTGGGKTLLAVETIRRYQENFVKKRTGLVVWIVHRDQIYRQTLSSLTNKNHIYRQLLDQVSGNRTIIVEKGQQINQKDLEENLCVLILMIQSTNRTDYSKLEVFKDSGGFANFFPSENRTDEHEEILRKYPNLDYFEDNIFNKKLIKTSLGNMIRTQNTLFIIDEFHRMWSDKAKATLDNLNPSFIFGLSATPPKECNILHSVSGRSLNDEEMIKLDLHLIPPANNSDWRDVVSNIKSKRDELEKIAMDYNQNNSVYIRPIALIQVDRTGKDQRGLSGFVHAEDVREYLQQDCSVESSSIAVKSATIDEIKEEKLLSKDSEIRYIITKEALSEGWDCSFAYILGIIPNTQSNTGLTQLVGRILRQPYASKTGNTKLDESYVYYTQGETQRVLSQIKSGFEEEGLGDLITGIIQSGSNGESSIPPRRVAIKKEIIKDFSESLYLPQWIIKKENRKLHYEIDIRPKIEWENFDINNWVKSNLIPSLGAISSIKEIIVNIEGNSLQGEEVINHTEKFDTLFITRRVSDVIINPFYAYSITEKLSKIFIKLESKEKLDEYNGYIASEFVKSLKEFKKKEEERIFNQLILDKKLVLSVSSDDGIVYTLPRYDYIVNTGFQINYEKSLYENIDSASMNPLEKKVASMLDANPNVLWWARNRARTKDNSWYSIQGWQKDKVRPDFVVARKNINGELEIVYIMETKGEHLIANSDSEYKSNLFKKINEEIPSIEKISTLSFKLNKDFQFEFIKQNDEERHIGSLFNER